MKSELYELKWKKFLKRVRPFRFVPFVEFVLAAGSLATGKVHEGSDFDVMVGVRQGRIFTARFFSVVIFELFGYRRKGTDHKGNVSDKICLNHFITESAYKLRPPYEGTWVELYQSLVPVMGDEEKIKEGKQFIIFGLIGLFIMVAVWGIIASLQGTFGLGTEPVPPGPATNF